MGFCLMGLCLPRTPCARGVQAMLIYVAIYVANDTYRPRFAFSSVDWKRDVQPGHILRSTAPEHVLPRVKPLKALAMA